MYQDLFKNPTFDFISENFADKIRSPKEDFEKIKAIGAGGMGRVDLYKDLRNGQLVAIKFPDPDAMENFEKYFCREVICLAITDSPFMVSLYGFHPKSPYSIMMRYIPNGSLDNYVNQNSKKKLSPTQKTIIAAGIAHAFARFHEYGLIYRDLKPDNILLDDKFYPIICDFGIARDAGQSTANDKEEIKTKAVGTFGFIAPELIDDSTEVVYNQPVDVYSYAMLLFNMIENHRPFIDLKVKEALQAVYLGKKPEYSKEKAGSIETVMAQAWNNDPAARPTFAQIFKMFESHKAMFPGTDISKVNKFFETISDTTETITENLFTSTMALPAKPGYLLQTVTANSFFNQIIDKNNSLSPQSIVLNIKLMTKKEAAVLLTQISKYLQENPDIDDYHLYIIYKAINQILKDDDKFIDILNDNGFASIIRVDGEYSKKIAKKLKNKLSGATDIQQILENINLEKLKNLLSDKIKNISDLEKVDDVASDDHEKLLKRYKDPTTGEIIFVKTVEKSQFNEKLFCNEVLILSSIDNPFILPFYGFSPTPPYQIMTKYIPNGSLEENIMNDKLNPTQLTIIAIGLAYVLARFHERGFIHRYIKPENILLDENYYPILSGFGINHNLNGAMQYMAPEATHEQFSEKSDVYAYGITLFKMLTKRIPFEFYSIVQYQNAINHNEHDFYDLSKAGSLSKIIDKCWDYDPDKRPSFSQIYYLFEAHKVIFEGSDVSQIDRFIDYINETSNILTQQFLTTKIGKQLNSDVASSSDQIFDRIISDSPSLSPQGLNSIVQNISEKTSRHLFKKLAEYLNNQTNIPESIIFLIYNSVYQIMSKGPSYSKEIASSPFVQTLDFTKESILHFSYAIFINFMLIYPDGLQAKEIEPLAKNQVKKNPHLIAYILSLYFKYLVENNKDIDEDVVSLFKVFSSNVKPFMKTNDCESFLRVVSYFYPELINKLKSRIKEVYKILFKSFTKIMKSNDPVSIHFAYHFSINMMPKGTPREIFTVSEELLEDHVTQFETLLPDIISYLVTYINVSAEVVTTLPFDLKRLINFAPNHSPAFLLLQFLSEDPNWAYKLVTSDEVWDFKSSIPREFYIKLMLTISRLKYQTEDDQQIELKQILFSKDKTYFLLRSLSKTKDTTILNAICKIYSVLLDADLNSNPHVFFNEKRMNDITKNKVLNNLSELMKIELDVNESTYFFNVLAGFISIQLSYNLITFETIPNQLYAKTFTENVSKFIKNNKSIPYILSILSTFCQVPSLNTKLAGIGIKSMLQEIYPTIERAPPKLQENLRIIYEKIG